MEKINALCRSPKYINDIVILKKALYTLETLEQETGQEYVYKYIQQPMLGGTCFPEPKHLIDFSKIRKYSKSTILLDICDKNYLINKIEELSKDIL